LHIASRVSGAKVHIAGNSLQIAETIANTAKLAVPQSSEFVCAMARASFLQVDDDLRAVAEFCSLQNEFLRLLASTCDTLIIDEGHHVPATSWQQVKKVFESVKCLQFTATPFRNDGKKVDGDIIYNFPRSLAHRF
jgi:hypothetical protein